MKFVCKECDLESTDGTDILVAPNPFDPEDIVQGCPSCKQVNTLRIACAYDGCWRETTNGAPWPDGVYRWTCSDHSLWRQEKTAGVLPNWPDPIPRNNQQS